MNVINSVILLVQLSFYVIASIRLLLLAKIECVEVYRLQVSSSFNRSLKVVKMLLVAYNNLSCLNQTLKQTGSDIYYYLSVYEVVSLSGNNMVNVI